MRYPEIMASAKQALAKAQPRPAEKGDYEKAFEGALALAFKAHAEPPEQTAFDMFIESLHQSTAEAASFIWGLAAGRLGK